MNSSSAIHVTALQGASLAFAHSKLKPAVKPKPKPNTGHVLDSESDGTYMGRKGALAAATKVGISNPYSSGGSGDEQLEKPCIRSSASSASVLQCPGRLDLHLQAPKGSYDGSRSVSLIAATLAASRSSRVSRNLTQQNLGNKKYSRSPSLRSTENEIQDSDAIDMAPQLAPENLIGIPEPKGVKKIASETSIPPPSTRRSPLRESGDLQISVNAVSPQTKISMPGIKYLKPTVTRGFSYPSQKPNIIPPSVRCKPSLQKIKPVLMLKSPRTERTGPEKEGKEEEEGSFSDDSFVSASQNMVTPTGSPQLLLQALFAEQKRVQPTCPHTTTEFDSSVGGVDFIENAIIASTLASSRAVSAMKHKPSFYPALPPPRKKRSIFHAGKSHTGNGKRRASSPARQSMRQTLRKVKSKGEVREGEHRRSRKSLVKKHSNKHHEGDRKCWRDTLTEKERKRYEAVWASNKGLYCGPNAKDKVCNLVVRDIWSRSRLEAAVLEEVYELVDLELAGSLGRDEFVVGMWLIDQRLRGRKLPIRVRESVWRSVRLPAYASLCGCAPKHGL